MTKTDDNRLKLNKTITNKSTNKTKLPWWVELLFVQVGLPEDYLSSLLSYRNLARNNLLEHKNKYIYVCLGVLSLVYVNPIIKNSRHNNICVSQSIQVIEKKAEFRNTNIGTAFARAINYCNGGINTDLK